MYNEQMSHDIPFSARHDLAMLKIGFCLSDTNYLSYYFLEIAYLLFFL